VRASEPGPDRPPPSGGRRRGRPRARLLARARRRDAGRSDQLTHHEPGISSLGESRSASRSICCREPTAAGRPDGSRRTAPPDPLRVVDVDRSLPRTARSKPPVHQRRPSRRTMPCGSARCRHETTRCRLRALREAARITSSRPHPPRGPRRSACIGPSTSIATMVLSLDAGTRPRQPLDVSSALGAAYEERLTNTRTVASILLGGTRRCANRGSAGGHAGRSAAMTRRERRVEPVSITLAGEPCTPTSRSSPSCSRAFQA
jgi:hypothetical protein